MGEDEQTRRAGPFGHLGDELASRIVAALREAHAIGLRTQAASEQPRRYGYGSTWISRYEQMVEHLGVLPGAQVVPVPRAAYRLDRVAGRLLIPFHLAPTIAEVPRHPRLGGDTLRALAARSVAVARPEPTLFDPEPDGLADDQGHGSELDPVLVGVVCHAEARDLVAVLWGPVTSVDDDGRVTWTPEAIPLPRADPAVPRARTPVHDTRSPSSR